MNSAPRKRRRVTDEAMDRWIGLLLRAGVILAAAVGASGGALFIVRRGSQAENFHYFHGVRAGLDSVQGVVSGAFTLRSRWIIQLGLLILIATPIARVALSILAFALQRDFRYVVVTSIVLGLLLFSLLGPEL